MQHGYIKVAAGTPAIRVGDCTYNAEEILALMKKAADAGVRVLVLPELCITGYTCGDLFLHDTLLEAAQEALMQVVLQSSAWDMVTAVGLPLRHRGKLYNCAAVMHAGRLLGVVPKSAMPNYGALYELRHFTPAPEEQSTITIGEIGIPFGRKQLFCCTTLEDLRVAVEIGEDLWVPAPPSISLVAKGANIIVNLSASNETIDKGAYRRLLIEAQSAKLCCAYLYADAGWGESTTDMVFAGHNIVAENGALLTQSEPFAADTVLAMTEIDVQRLAFERRRQNTFHFDHTLQEAAYQEIPFSMAAGSTPLTRTISKTPFVPEDLALRRTRCEEVVRIQAQGLRKRLAHVGGKPAVIGVSGGLDSTLALLVAVEAMRLLGLPLTTIQAITMPCFGTTARTKNNAQRLCEALGVPCKTVDITAAVQQHFHDIGHDAKTLDTAYENAQARERMQVLMDTANLLNGLVIGTGDLSELALGWATYNGDHMSMYGVNASIPKTLVRHIVEYFADTNEALRDVLQDILQTPVSPELLPAKDGEIAQQTEQIVGPYVLHDFFLYHMIRWGAQPGKVLRMACHAFEGVYEKDTIRHWLQVFCNRFFSQQFKRSCMPDGPKVGSVALSPRGDWRMPSDAVNSAWMRQL